MLPSPVFERRAPSGTLWMQLPRPRGRQVVVALHDTHFGDGDEDGQMSTGRRKTRPQSHLSRRAPRGRGVTGMESSRPGPSRPPSSLAAAEATRQTVLELAAKHEEAVLKAALEIRAVLDRLG